MSFRDAFYGCEDGVLREERMPRRLRGRAGADFLREAFQFEPREAPEPEPGPNRPLDLVSPRERKKRAS